jgi:peptidoglycan/xylan/chitin deacetylase (PgdA/CDA1 family)
MILRIFAVSAIFFLLSDESPAFNRPSVHVLCYHAFLKKSDPYCITIDELRSQIERYKKDGYRFVTLDDVKAGRLIGGKNILVTVDDGNKTVYEAYYKVFRPNGIKPVLGIYPAIISHVSYALTWEQLEELSKRGCDIAAHGYHHLKIAAKLYKTRPRDFNREIFKSKKVLEDRLGRKIDTFVYPFGLTSEITMKILRKAEFRYAFTIKPGGISLPIAAGNLELPRYMVTKTNDKWCRNMIARNYIRGEKQKQDKLNVADKGRGPDAVTGGKKHAGSRG